MLRGQQQTITFYAVDSASPPARKSGLSLAASDVKISKDGGSFASATNAPAELGTTGRYSLTLTAAETNCAWLHIYVEKTGMQPQEIVGDTSDNAVAAVVADGTNTASAFVTNLSSSVTDFYKDALVRFTSGSLAGQVKKVTGYNGTTKALSFSAGFTAAPGTGDLFALVTI